MISTVIVCKSVRLRCDEEKRYTSGKEKAIFILFWGPIWGRGNDVMTSSMKAYLAGTA